MNPAGETQIIPEASTSAVITSEISTPESLISVEAVGEEAGDEYVPPQGQDGLYFLSVEEGRAITNL